MKRKKESNLVKALEVIGIIGLVGLAGFVVYAQNQYTAKKTAETYKNMGLDSNAVERAVNYRFYNSGNSN